MSFIPGMNRTLCISIILTFFVLLIVPIYSYATHLRAGEITVEIIDCKARKVRITITVFTNTKDTNVLFGGQEDWLDFGDGEKVLVPEQPNVIRNDLGENIATATYTIEHTYRGNSKYVISYSEPNRNAGVLNMDGSVNTLFYIETQVTFLSDVGCNNSPKLLIPPIDQGCTGVAFFHNPGAFDPDKGDSLSYEMVIPFRAKNTTVINYKSPNDPKFYTNYSTGNEQQTGAPTFAINPIDGTITWDAPGFVATGEYNIAFIVREWRKVSGTWTPIGFVRRDMQILVKECKNERPDLEVPDELCVEAGTLIDETIFGTDPDGDPVKIEAFSEILNFTPPATYTPFPATFQPTTPSKASVQFKWQTECFHVQDQPYNVIFKITDNSPTGSKLVTFKTWSIRVVGPKPEWDGTPTFNASTRSVDLKWKKYDCFDNAVSMQIWRRVDELPFVPDNCQTGMPDNLGYTLINTVPIKKPDGSPFVDYKDSDIASGAKYCYRLVALFPLPGGGESYVSEERCVDPIPADEPIITHVTVDKTDVNNGQITLRWKEPFEADQTLYPTPYQYEIYRSEGFSGNLNRTLIETLPDPDKDNPAEVIEYVDPALNTEDKVYNYSIKAIAANNLEVGTSEAASSVRLEASSQLKKIQLTWTADVPWSNVVAGQVHEIFRGDEGQDESTFVSVGTVLPSEGGFTFTDEGPLEDGKLYCYRVLTRGSYGNPDIQTPLENYSQRICALPGDDEAPCKPTLLVQLRDCANLPSDELCTPKLISNTVYWNRPDEDCAKDIAGYRVYRSKSIDGIYIPLNTTTLVKDTFFIDTQIESFAYCYKLQQVDRSGNESELSDPACNDNCIYYELPNVFTPNKDSRNCNELFSAFSTNFRYIIPDESGDGKPDFVCDGIVDESKCARGVLKVALTVYNRWGKEVYNYESGTRENKSIYIDWDGKGSDGVELPSAVYYYMAEVTFDTVQPEKTKIIKGWVHLLR